MWTYFHPSLTKFIIPPLPTYLFPEICSPSHPKNCTSFLPSFTLRLLTLILHTLTLIFTFLLSCLSLAVLLTSFPSLLVYSDVSLFLSFLASVFNLHWLAVGMAYGWLHIFMSLYGGHHAAVMSKAMNTL